MSIYEGNMDKPISAQKKQARRRRQIIIIGGALVAFSGILISIQSLVTPTFDKNEIKIGTVSRGNVYESISASAVIESATENIILSPATTKLKQILLGAGSQVKKGDTILILDADPLKKKYADAYNQLKLKENSLWQDSLNTQKLKLELIHNRRVKLLRITELETQILEERKLFKVGGISQERIRKTEQSLTLVKQELELLQNKNRIELEKLSAAREALIVQTTIAKQSVYEADKVLSKSYITAPISGIIVEVNGSEGEMVNSNNLLSRISDLKHFKLTGTIADSFADKINTGGKVMAIKDDYQLEGVIGNVRPLVDNNQIKFDIYLKQDDHPDLRPNQKMELRVITQQHSKTLRLPDGMFFDGSKSLDVFVVEGNQAVKKKVKVGLSNYDFIEILEGLSENDKVIISSMKGYEHMDKVLIE